MRKLFVILFLFCPFYGYSQTWTEPSGFGGRYTEWSIITRDEWNRILRQYVEDDSRCSIIYTDALKMRMRNNVLSGTRPPLNGYYFLYGKWYGYNDVFDFGWDPVLAYGNSNTGRMEIKFSWLESMYANSNEFINLYSRYVRRVYGE